jgi:hypothetical protein
MQMIKKPAILITSLGRTGTEFFAKFFEDILPNAASLHEPDIFQSTREDKLAHYMRQVRQAGIRRMFILKALGLWTLVKLSDARFTGNLSSEQAIKKLHFQRHGFIDQLPGNYYVEANIGYYGLLDITPNVFENHRAVFIVRDGRDWIRSHMNWGEFYGKSGLRKLISHNWPTARELPNDPHHDKWDGYTRFEKLCWAWARLNEYALHTMADKPHVRLFQFEKIFSGDSRYQTLNELVEFTTSQPGMDKTHLGSTRGWLERKIHQSSEGFPEWGEWTKNQKNQFEQICGRLMDNLGYKL